MQLFFFVPFDVNIPIFHCRHIDVHEYGVLSQKLLEDLYNIWITIVFNIVTVIAEQHPKWFRGSVVEFWNWLHSPEVQKANHRFGADRRKQAFIAKRRTKSLASMV